MKFNFKYEGTPITKTEFEKNVPDDWLCNLDEYNEYCYGYYKATPRD